MFLFTINMVSTFVLFIFARMKTPIRIFFVFLYCLFGVYACKHADYPSSLLKADSLTCVQPDSAIILLQNIQKEIDRMPKATQMYYRLLCIKAQDKAYVTHSSDTLIKEVIHYYENQKDYRHLPEAYYYAGRVYRDLGDSPQALAYFDKAIEILPVNDGYELKSRIYSQKGSLFLYQGLYVRAIAQFRMSHQCDIALKDSIGMVYNLRDIGNAYRLTNKMDSARIYLQEANMLSQRLRRQDLFNMLQSQLAALYIDLQAYDSAKIVLQNALLNVEDSNKSGIYSIAARFYYAIGKIDSATWYYSKLLNFGTVYAQQTAYRHLLELSIKQNDTEYAPIYLHGYVQSVDSVLRLAQTETTPLVDSLYHYQLLEKESQRLKIESQNKTLGFKVIVFMLFITIIFLVIYRYCNKSRKPELKQELEKSLATKGISKSDISKKRSEQKIELLNRILQQQIVENEQEKDAQKRMFDSGVFKELQKRANSVRGEAYVTSEEWKLLKELITPAYPHFFERLYSLHTLNDNELHVCILLKFQFRQADIARLLQLKPESISSIRKRLCQKVTGNDGKPIMWDNIIHSL